MARCPFAQSLSDPFLIGIHSQIWHNSLIRIDDRPLFYKSWFQAGVKEVKDLLDADQNFMSFTSFKAKYKIRTNYLEYYKELQKLGFINRVDNVN